MTQGLPERYLSARDRLAKLPVVFTLSTLINLLPPRETAKEGAKQASVYLTRWRQANLVESFGRRTGIYFNLVKDVYAPSRYENEALKLLFPDGVIGGASALHRAGATTQIPQFTDLIVLRPEKGAPTTAHPPHYELHVRSKSWFRLMRPYLDFTAEDSLPTLSPEAALADLWRTPVGKGWRPDADDIDMDMLDEEKLFSICQLMGVSLPADFLLHFEQETHLSI